MANNDCNEEWGLPPMKRFKCVQSEEEKLQVKLAFDNLFHQMKEERANRKEKVKQQVEEEI